MPLKTADIIRIRSHLKNRLMVTHNLAGFENEKETLVCLLNRTIDAGESNSALLIGPRGIGKTTLINAILNEIETKQDFNKSAVLVRLHGLLHTDDRLAIKSITTQMNLDNAIDGKVFGSFAENLSFLLACLRTGQKDTTKSILFILEEFDLFCGHHNQTLLYNLFDISQSAQTPVCVLGITCRLDVMELFEKRVKSRFSHRQIFMFAEQNNDSQNTLANRMNTIRGLLLCDSIKGLSENSLKEWNASIQSLLSNKKFKHLMQHVLDINSNENFLKNIILLVISKLQEYKPNLTLEDFEEEVASMEKDDTIRILNDLSILELCLVIAMKHHNDIYDGEPFNFEMILTRYLKFVNTSSNIQQPQRSVILKAFEHLQKMELILLLNNSMVNRLKKEYQLFRLLVTSQQVHESTKNYQGLPTEVVQWANSSLV